MQAPKPNPLQKLVAQYSELFDHGPPPSACEQGEQALMTQLEEAIKTGVPVPGWIDEPFGSRVGPGWPASQRPEDVKAAEEYRAKMGLDEPDA